MTSKMYVIVFDMLTLPHTEELRQCFMEQKSVFHRWWNHLPFAFLAVSDNSADEISEVLHQVMKGKRFLVAEINVGNINGILAKQSWDWILDRGEEVAHAKSA